jgi:hypothetical protein
LVPDPRRFDKLPVRSVRAALERAAILAAAERSRQEGLDHLVPGLWWAVASGFAQLGDGRSAAAVKAEIETLSQPHLPTQREPQGETISPSTLS